MLREKQELVIIKRVLDGDINEFEKLIELHQDHVARILSAHIPRDSVEEVAHEVFIRCYNSLDGYKPQKAFKAWLATIAIRSCHDFWRKRYRNREVPASEFAEDCQLLLENALASKSRDEFEALARQREARELADALLDRVKPLDRMILVLTYVQGMTAKEAANLLEISVANVKVRSFRARKTLRQYYNKLSFGEKHGS